jgi:hypothetical protein
MDAQTRAHFFRSYKWVESLSCGVVILWIGEEPDMTGQDVRLIARGTPTDRKLQTDLVQEKEGLRTDMESEY